VNDELWDCKEIDDEFRVPRKPNRSTVRKQRDYRFPEGFDMEYLWRLYLRDIYIVDDFKMIIRSMLKMCDMLDALEEDGRFRATGWRQQAMEVESFGRPRKWGFHAYPGEFNMNMMRKLNDGGLMLREHWGMAIEFMFRMKGLLDYLEEDGMFGSESWREWMKSHH